MLGYKWIQQDPSARPGVGLNSWHWTAPHHIKNMFFGSVHFIGHGNSYNSNISSKTEFSEYGKLLA
jgi:hypothetical protein